MSARKLVCYTDGTHTRFRGTILICSRQGVTLTPEWVETNRERREGHQDLTEIRDSPVTCAECGRQVWGMRQAITFIPAAGMVLLCDFTTGFRPPEIVKVRPAVVLSERGRNRETCIVVPISTVETKDQRAVTIPLSKDRYNFLEEDSWAKCQCPYTVGLGRLYRLRVEGRSIDSRQTMISDDDLKSVRRGAAASLGLS